MMELLRHRRSVRHFLTRPVEPEKIETLQQAALLSPTSRNLRPWSFYFVTDPAYISTLAAAKAHGSAFAKQAPLVIVIAADESVSDVWIEDCSIASIMLQLAAEELKLGSCWIQIRNRETTDKTSSEEYVRTLLELPAHMRIESFIAIGYPKHKPEPLDLQTLDKSVIHCL